MELVGCMYTRKINIPRVVPGIDANQHRRAGIHTITLQHKGSCMPVPAPEPHWETVWKHSGYHRPRASQGPLKQFSRTEDGVPAPTNVF